MTLRLVIPSKVFRSQLNLNTLRQVSRNQRGYQRLCDLKKKRPLSISSDNSCFFTHNGITAPKTTREGQESTTKTRLHLAMTSNVQEASAFYSESSKQVPLLGLLLRGCRPKLRSMSGRVEVIQPVVRACTTSWLKGKGKGILFNGVKVADRRDWTRPATFRSESAALTTAPRDPTHFNADYFDAGTPAAGCHDRMGQV